MTRGPLTLPVLQTRNHVNQHSLPEAKIALFGSLFRGRDDVYPRRFESKKQAGPDTSRRAATNGSRERAKSRGSNVRNAPTADFCPSLMPSSARTFPAEELQKWRVEAKHPDEFISLLWEASPDAVIEAAKQQRASLKHPPMSTSEFLDSLARQQIPGAVARLRAVADRL